MTVHILCTRVNITSIFLYIMERNKEIKLFEALEIIERLEQHIVQLELELKKAQYSCTKLRLKKSKS